MIAATKKRFYPDRSWTQVFMDAKDLMDSSEIERLRQFITAHPPNVKRDDALLLLHTIAQHELGTHPRTDFDFEPTLYWRIMERDVLHNRQRPSPLDAHKGDASPGLSEFGRHVRSVSPDGEETLRTALLLYLASAEIARRGTVPEVTEQAYREVVARLEGQRDALSPQEFEELVNLDLICEHLISQACRPHVDALLPFALALRGRLRATIAAMTEATRAKVA
jgi:hypothetical protein